MPDNYALSIIVDGVDVTSYVPFPTLSIDDYVHDVSWMRFEIEDPVGLMPELHHNVLVLAKTLDPVLVVFRGIIMKLETVKRDNGITLKYIIEVADQKIRLQKSIVPPADHTGVDTDIIEDIFGEAYPDLSDEFDFTDGTDPFATDLDFPTNDDSLLDALNRLGEKADSRWRMDRGNAVNPSISFTNVDDGIKEFPADYPYWTGGAVFGTVGVSSGDGNPGHCLKWTQSGASGGTNKGMTFDIFFAAGTNPLSPVQMDVWYLGSGNDLEIRLGSTNVVATVNAALEGTWQTVALPSVTIPELLYYPLFLRLPSGAAGANEIRIDNVIVGDIEGYVTTRDQLRWSGDTEATDFNIDVDTGSEFAFDIDFSQGDVDDFNSVIVIGGKENVPIDWTYESRGEQEHFDLELPVKSIAVYKNTGSDATPVWDLQTLGTWGVDKLLSETGGTKEVLYDNENHWLLFDTNPPDLAKSIRVTGTIEKPIRTLVSGAATGTPVLVNPIYDDTISSVDDAVAIGQAALDKKNAIKRLKFKTYNPGLKVGQAIQVTDSARGLDETLIIHTMRIRWLGASGHAQFEVECGEQDTLSADIIISDLDKRTRGKTNIGAIDTSTVELLADVDGQNLLDVNNNLLYEIG